MKTIDKNRMTSQFNIFENELLPDTAVWISDDNQTVRCSYSMEYNEVIYTLTKVFDVTSIYNSPTEQANIMNAEIIEHFLKKYIFYNDWNVLVKYIQQENLRDGYYKPCTGTYSLLGVPKFAKVIILNDSFLKERDLNLTLEMIASVGFSNLTEIKVKE